MKAADDITATFVEHSVIQLIGLEPIVHLLTRMLNHGLTNGGQQVTNLSVF